MKVSASPRGNTCGQRRRLDHPIAPSSAWSPSTPSGLFYRSINRFANTTAGKPPLDRSRLLQLRIDTGNPQGDLSLPPLPSFQPSLASLNDLSPPCGHVQ